MGGFLGQERSKKKSILFFAVVAALITNFDTTVAWDHLCSFMENEIKGLLHFDAFFCDIWKNGDFCNSIVVYCLQLYSKQSLGY